MKPRRSRLSSLLDSEDLAFIESSDDELAASEGDICRCGKTRKEHEGEEGLVATRKCRKFREAL